MIPPNDVLCKSLPLVASLACQSKRGFIEIESQGRVEVRSKLRTFERGANCSSDTAFSLDLNINVSRYMKH